MQLRTAVEAHGLTLDCIEGVPKNWLDCAMLGLPGADEQIAAFQATIRAMGQAGITVALLQLDPRWRLAHCQGRAWPRTGWYDDAPPPAP